MGTHDFQPQTTVRRIDTVFSSSVGDDLVIFDHARGAYYGSGPVGEAIWALIEEPLSVSAICDRLMEQFEVDRATCEREVIDFLGDLGTRGLIVTG